MNPILVYLDASEDNLPVVHKAEYLARRWQAPLVLFSAVFHTALARGLSSNQTDRAQNQQASYLQEQEQKLEATARQLRERGLDVSTRVAWCKHAWNAIDKLVREQPFDLILKGTHHQNVVQRTFFSSTDWDLMRCSPLPVLLVKDAPWPDSGLRMTACVDPVEQGDAPRNLDKAILLQARVWQEALGTDLEVLNVYDPTPFIVYMDPPVPDTTPITEALAEQHQEALDKLLDDSGLGRNLGRLEAGTPTSSIPELVQQSGSHVVILGAQTREGIDRWLIGHTAEKILDRIRCDVLVIKTDQSGG